MIVQNYVGGRWQPSSGTEAVKVTNSATGEEIGRTPLSTVEDVDAAVKAAAAAFPAWRATPAVERARVLFRLKALLDEHKEELARSLTREHGKVIAETRREIDLFRRWNDSYGYVFYLMRPIG